MVPLKVKEDQILVKPAVPSLSRGSLLLIKNDQLFRRGVVQTAGLLAEAEGIFPGDTVYYAKPTLKTEHGDYVDIENVLCLETSK